MGLKISQHNADPARLGTMNLSELAHALRIAQRRLALGGLHAAPRTMSVEKHERMAPVLMLRELARKS